MKIFLAQTNPLVGDLNGNTKQLIDICHMAAKSNSQLIITPELSLWGYPPKDLLLSSFLVEKQVKCLEEIQNAIRTNSFGFSILVGIAEKVNDDFKPDLFNSIAIINKDRWEVIARKQLLPTYDVFDEKRYFRPGNSSNVLKIKTVEKELNIGITICEDIWGGGINQLDKFKANDPISKLLDKDIDLLINLSASPFSKSKKKSREIISKKAVSRLSCPIIYLNQVGGNDELIFDGSSFILNKKQESILYLNSCQEDYAIWDTDSLKKNEAKTKEVPEEELLRALVLGVRDYTKKCGFNSALIGLSGGIDSALVAIIASAALGPERVKALLMPSPWSSSGSIKDSLDLAKRIGFSAITSPISNLMTAYDDALKAPLDEPPQGLTAENLQSRIRGTLLMAVANQEGHLLLSTGNKSELAVGYCTLYGDMNGGIAVIGDLYKTEVFDLCKWLDNDASKEFKEQIGLPSKGELVGEKIINKPPSAELKPEQLDSDVLPDYSLLDEILKKLIEEKKQPEELIENGIDPKILTKIKNLLKKGEFKRYQAPPLLKVSDHAFGSGWRIPIAAI